MTSPAQQTLERRLGPLDGAAIIVSNVIGGTILFAPPFMAGLVPNPWLYLGLWVAGVSNVGPVSAGPWAGRRCIGCSLVIGPDGREVLKGPYGQDAETVLYVDVTPHRRAARGSSWGAVS